MLASWPVRDFYERLSAGNFEGFKTYLELKYFFGAILDDDDAARAGLPSDCKETDLDELQLPAGSRLTQEEVNVFGEFIYENNPYRERWEQPDKVLDFIKIKPGSSVADLGSGAGFYTFKFASLVGSEGVVYSVDTVQAQLDNIIAASTRHKLANIRTVLAKDNDTRLPENGVDLAFICSMYHAAYFNSMEYVRDGFIKTLRAGLRKDGRLVICDNAIVAPGENGYYGPAIAPELIICQLKYYGFRLVDRAQFIPQRYLLVFEKEGEPAPS